MSSGAPTYAGVSFRRMADVFREATGADLRREGTVIRVDGERFDSADPLQRALVERHFVDLLLSRLEGVTLHDPARIWIEADVTVAPGAVLWPNVVLRGRTVIGAAEIGVGAVLTDTRVDDGAVVKPYTVCEGAHIGADAAVGPMAHLRTGADLRAGVKVGNFVEVKKTVLHEGAKASHLTYLGDAEIGAGANIGAGTITCNYDGYNKWRTTIGAGAFIGSNTALVAPITVGAGAIVGAGSTLSKDVADDALAVERAEAKTVAGLAKRIRRKNQAIKDKST
jgi:bifunctional UDP-N-acetylglucosamine pyrophosphorylase/glucosamine-1-phosphate N-acetyltransferase